MRTVSLWNRPNTNKFETSELLQKPKKILLTLRAKENELKLDAKKNGPRSLDQQKLTVISNILNELDIIINHFNRVNTQMAFTEAMIALLRDMLKTVNEHKSQHASLLLKPRNNNRKDANQLVYYGTFSTTLIFSSTLSLTTLGKLIFLVGISPRASDKAVNLLGLEDMTPASFRLLTQLSIVLQEMLNEIYATHKKLNREESKEASKDSAIDEFVCPINYETMEDPVVCKLDGHSYERSAITRWLFQHRNSPVNREKMKNNETVNDVIIPNRNLKSLIGKDVMVVDKNLKVLVEKYNEDPKSFDDVLSKVGPK